MKNTVVSQCIYTTIIMHFRIDTPSYNVYVNSLSQEVTEDFLSITEILIQLETPCTDFLQ